MPAMPGLLIEKEFHSESGLELNGRSLPELQGLQVLAWGFRFYYLNLETPKWDIFTLKIT
jgi:hypothetical protein